MVAVAVVGVNPGNPDAEVSSCGFFPQGLAGDMLASLIASQTLIPNRRVAVATYPSRTGVVHGVWSVIQCCVVLLCVEREGAESRGVEERSDEAEQGQLVMPYMD